MSGCSFLLCREFSQILIKAHRGLIYEMNQAGVSRRANAGGCGAECFLCSSPLPPDSSINCYITAAVEERQSAKPGRAPAPPSLLCSISLSFSVPSECLVPWQCHPSPGAPRSSRGEDLSGQQEGWREEGRVCPAGCLDAEAGLAAEAAVLFPKPGFGGASLLGST